MVACPCPAAMLAPLPVVVASDFSLRPIIVLVLCRETYGVQWPSLHSTLPRSKFLL